MSRNILNEGPEVNVYLNRDPIAADLPVQALQPTASDPITISLKGLPTSFSGRAGQVIKVNTSENGLEYATDGGSNWTVSGSNIYPTTATQILANTTSNTNNYGVLSKDKDITVENSAGNAFGFRLIYDTSSIINYIQTNGDAKWQGATNLYEFDNKVKATQGQFTGQLTLGSTITDGTYTFTLPSSTGTLALTSDLTGYITASSTDTLTNKTLNGTNCKVSTAQFIMEAGAGLKNSISQGYIDFFEAPSNGSNKITLQGVASLAGDTVLNLPSSNGTLALTTDIDTTTDTNFGTSVTGGNTINLGNSQGTGQTVPLVLNFSGMTFKNTSGATIATFTPVSNTCDMTLNGGLIKTATLSTNTIWNGNTIGTTYGGTGLTSYTTGDILYASGTNTLSKLAIGTTGQVLKVSGGLPAWGADSSSNWTVSGSNIYPTTATQLLVNTSSNTNNRKLLVNGDGEVQGKLYLSSTSSEMEINSNSSTGIYFNNAASSGFKLFADNGNFGCPVVNALSTNPTGWLLELRQAGTKYHRFTKGSHQLFSNNASTDIATMYFIKESNILYGNSIERDFTNNTFKLRDYGLSYDNDFMLVDLSSTNRKTTTFNKHAQFKISSGSGNLGDCTLVIEADNDNTVETSNPIIQLTQDGGAVNAYLQLSDNDLSLGGTFSAANTIIYTNGGTINLSSDSGSSANVATLNTTLTDIKSTSTKVAKLQTNTIEATNQSNNIITSNSTLGWKIYGNNSTYSLSFDNGGATYFPYIGSAGTGNGVIHTHIDGIAGGNPWVVDNTDNTAGGIRQTWIGNDARFASSRVGLGYSSSYGRIYNPSGTNGANTNAGSHIHYHDNGTALFLNVPNTTYATTNSNNIQFLSGGTKRVIMNGSENPAMSFYQTNGSTIYGNIGRASTFPANFGEWSSVTVPISGNTSLYFGGANTNDTEGSWIAMNGNTTGISNTGDDRTFWWYDEDDTGTTNWYITTGGVIVSTSDIRLKTNIETYKNSDFEKFKKIRTIKYNHKIPENINPERLKKQSCIDKYNELHYGVVAQELYDIYPEIEDTKDRDKWIYRRDNWDNGVYEEEHKKWLEEKEKCEYDQKDCEDKCEYKTPEPQKDFNEVEPMRKVEYQRLSLLTIGVVQDLIIENEKLKEDNESLKQELNNIKEILARNNIV